MNDTQKKLVAVAVFAAALVALGTAVVYAYNQNTAVANNGNVYGGYGQYGGNAPYGYGNPYSGSAPYGSSGQPGGRVGGIGGMGGHGMGMMR
jgi:hypothetical protein